MEGKRKAVIAAILGLTLILLSPIDEIIAVFAAAKYPQYAPWIFTALIITAIAALYLHDRSE
jgi:hypothetical protein